MEEYARRIVNHALKLGCQDAISDAYEVTNYQVRFSQNQVDITNSWRERGARVFVVYNKRVVTTDIMDLSKAKETVKKVVTMAKSSQPNPEYNGIAKGPFKYRRSSVDPKILTLDSGSDIVYSAINAALAEGAKETAGSFFRTNESHYLVSSTGVEAKDRIAGLYLSIRALSTPESSGHGVECASRLTRFKPERAGQKAGQVASLAKNPKPGEAGKFDVIFEPLFLGSMTDQLGIRASAFAVMAGLSPFVKKLGKQIASPIVTLYDDATIEGRGSKRFDEEGVPTRRTQIIQKGTLKTYLHNTSTAKLFKTKTTANAGLVGPSPHQLVLKPGTWKKEELFKECKNGILVTNTWYTRYQNYMTGEFSTIPRDGIFKVRKGEITGALKDIRVSDNIIHLWKNMRVLSNEVQEVEWWGEVSLPTMVPFGLASNIGVTRSVK